MMSKKLTTEEFITKARAVHGDRYDYSKAVYTNAKTKVCVICNQHGEFWVTPNNHDFGRGCYKCGRETLTTQQTKTSDQFIEDARTIHGNRYDYSNLKYRNVKSKVEIVCFFHGPFFQSPNSHLSGNGCRPCGIENSHKKQTKNLEQFIKDAMRVHGEKYDYSLVQYKNDGMKVNIICVLHGVFAQSPNSHLQGQGCAECRNALISFNKLKTTETFINEAIAIHGAMYDYTRVKYTGANENIEIICYNHGCFKQTPSSHLSGSGCVHCGLERARLLQTKDVKQFIKDAQLVHGGKYDYTKVEYQNSKTKIVIVCKEHGEWLQSPSSHLNGNGCPRCAGVGALDTDMFVIKAIDIHGVKYDYSLVEYVKSSRKIRIVCLIHGQFLQTPNSHLNGAGCGKCIKQISKPEIKWLDSLNVSESDRQYSIKIVNQRRRNVDGYDPATNTVYQFHGDYWHGNPNKFPHDKKHPVRKNMTYGQIYNETMRKDQEIRAAGYNLVTKWETEVP